MNNNLNQYIRKHLAAVVSNIIQDNEENCFSRRHIRANAH
jgi:hypothetical protein